MMQIPTPRVMSWPLGEIDENGRLAFASDDDSVRQVIRNILLTTPGERLMRPQFGAGLLDFVHQPNNQTTRNIMANVVTKAIQQWETRIQLESVEVLADNNNLSVVQICIHYQMIHTQRPAQLTLALDLA